MPLALPKPILFAALGALPGLSFVSSRGFSAEAKEFSVRAGNHERRDCPVRLELPESFRAAPSLRLTDVETGKPVPVQRLGKTEAAFILTRPLAKNGQRRFRLSTATEPDTADPAVRCVVNRGVAIFRVRNQHALAYNIEVVEPPDGLGAEFRRSGYLHPVWTPAGRALTDDFVPADEHKHGIYSAWVNASFQGRNLDFWNQWKKLGTIEHRRVLGKEEGQVFCALTAELAFVDVSVPGQPRDALYDEWTITMYAVGSGRLFEIESRQRCATRDPVQLPQHNYGGLAVRGPYRWQTQRQSGFLTSEGRDRFEGNYTRPNWVNMHGTIDGQPCGLTVFCHPTNFRAPQVVRLHPEFTYFVFTPCRLGPFEIKPGETHVARFRFFAQDGPPDAAKLNALWNDYASPPAVDWEK